MNPAANIVFITNMTRQNDPLAGIVGAIEVEKMKSYKEVPILFYIYDKKAAYQKLNDNKLKFDNFSNI